MRSRGWSHPSRLALAAGWAALAAVLGGCAETQYVHFRPVSTPAGDVPEPFARGTFRLPPGREVVAVEVAARGVIEKTSGGELRETVRVRLAMDNRGDEDFVMDPAKVRLVDDEGRAQIGATVEPGARPAREAHRGEVRQNRIFLHGHGAGDYALVFDLPAGARFETLGSFRFIGSYEYGGEVYEAEVKFVKVDVVYRYERYPYPCHPYYPWMDDEWGRWRFGFGYYYGR